MKKILQEKKLYIIRMLLGAMLINFFVIYMAAFTVLAAEAGSSPEDTIVASTEVSAMKEKRAIWISYEDIERYLQDTTEVEFRSVFTNMCDKSIANKLNTLIVHVRPMSDAIYPSAYYPWSAYITSDKENPGYDPLQIMIEIAHGKGLQIEAWINPYRVSNKTVITKKVKKTKFYKRYKSCIISYKSGREKCLVLDPAKSKARNLINNGVKELVTNYDIDGIHMDDYFYVSGMKDRLSSGRKRRNVNKLVKKLYATIKAIDSECTFGISPVGNLDNARRQGVDVDTWLNKSGYVDYVMPQIYWSDSYYIKGKKNRLFSGRAKQWYGLKKNDNVKLYVGLALYRVGESSSIDRGWKSTKKNLANQYGITRDLGYDGYALFTYRFLESGSSKRELENLKNSIQE